MFVVICFFLAVKDHGQNCHNDHANCGNVWEQLWSRLIRNQFGRDLCGLKSNPQRQNNKYNTHDIGTV